MEGSSRGQELSWDWCWRNQRRKKNEEGEYLRSIVRFRWKKRKSCVKSQTLWRSLFRLLQLPFPPDLSLWDFFQWCWSARTFFVLQLVLHILPALGLWVLWKTRCNLVYESLTPSASQAFHEVQALLRQLSEAHSFSCSSPSDTELVSRGILARLSPPKPRQLMIVRWMVPPPSKFKANVDGSTRGNPGLAAGGVVVRDSKGGFVAASTIYLGVQTNMHAEINALLHGLRLCESLYLASVIFESDSLQVVQMLSHGHSWPWRCYSELEEIQELITKGGHRLVHVYRQANGAADSLARYGRLNKCSSMFVLATLPSETKKLLSLDQQGVPSVRLKR